MALLFTVIIIKVRRWKFQLRNVDLICFGGELFSHKTTKNCLNQDCAVVVTGIPCFKAEWGSFLRYTGVEVVIIFEVPALL